MKWVPYILILLLVSAQVDDSWTFAAPGESFQFNPDNDEYLPSQKPTWEEESSSRRQPVLVVVNRRLANISLFRLAAPATWHLATPVTDSLYFMSLQI
jgi:hypothetical protein